MDGKEALGRLLREAVTKRCNVIDISDAGTWVAQLEREHHEAHNECNRLANSLSAALAELAALRAQPSEFQATVAAWAAETFPASTDAARLGHAAKELRELIARPNAEEEAADVLLILLHHASAHGFDLFDAARRKFEVVKQRKWLPPDEHGIVEHDREHERARVAAASTQGEVQTCQTCGYLMRPPICTKCATPSPQPTAAEPEGRWTRDKVESQGVYLMVLQGKHGPIYDADAMAVGENVCHGGWWRWSTPISLPQPPSGETP